MNTRDSRLTVTRSTDVPGIQHEAFFDPVDIGTAVGADTSNGVLEPNGWIDTAPPPPSPALGRRRSHHDPQPHRLTRRLRHRLHRRQRHHDPQPDVRQRQHHRLTWTVPDKPWADGDLLMLRIHKPISTDATLSGLALNGVDITFSPATTTYAASVPATTTQTTVTPTANHASATYVVKLGRANRRRDGTIPKTGRRR